MTVKVFALTSVDPDEIEALSMYMTTTTPLLERAGAKIAETHTLQATLVGAEMPARVTIVEYPDMEAVHSVFDSAEYGMLKDVRARAFKHYQIGILDD